MCFYLVAVRVVLAGGRFSVEAEMLMGPGAVARRMATQVPWKAGKVSAWKGAWTAGSPLSRAARAPGPVMWKVMGLAALGTVVPASSTRVART